MAEEKLNIYQKIAKIRKQVEVIQRNKSGFGYKYVDEEEILARITGSMDKYNLLLLPAIIHGTTEVIPYTTKKTKRAKDDSIYEENVNEIITKADMIFTWVNTESPEEKIETPWVLIGHQSDGSQSFGSGLTYATRYFLLKFFNIATPNDDPDNWRGKQKAANTIEDKLISEEIIATFDKVVKEFLGANDGKADDVKKFISKYIKGGNYFKIEDPGVAARLLSEFKEHFKIKE